jgi:hypothetical protein
MYTPLDHFNFSKEKMKRVIEQFLSKTGFEIHYRFKVNIAQTIGTCTGATTGSPTRPWCTYRVPCRLA